ncbi:expressed unknown protein [Seminavis robusta]|uniref:Uncharacterized protein n=1 Tax=Seminavis robusta TaxID=568900 RepID=A0A9N8DZU4_9STRA|nr:expressed unknown protein [Seminavis robusta]|eukprot:Sro480_g151350.1 n/a (422) ;mRNA; r:22509-23774
MTTEEVQPRMRVPRSGRMPQRSQSSVGGEHRPLQRTATGTATAGPPSRTRQPLKRHNTTGGRAPRGAAVSPRRVKKKGIRVAITVRKQEGDDEEQEKPEVEEEEDLKLYHMEVHCSGKFNRKVCWPDIDSFWGDPNTTIDKNSMCDLLEQYTQEQYPERRDADNLHPKRCYIKDEPLRGISFYKDYGWDPVKLHLKAREKKEVEILERYTKSVKLETIPVNFGTSDINEILIQQGDKAVISTLTKSKLQGHPLALEMMASETQIVVELRGLESIVGVLGNDEAPHDADPETGEQVWRDVKTLRALLADKKPPEKEGKGQHRILEVMALESYIKARVYYRAYVEGDVVSDHGVGLLLGERWWAHPLKDIMMGYNIDNAAIVWEDIELRYFSEIGYKMDNEYFDWENQAGKWVKVKKTREQPY